MKTSIATVSLSGDLRQKLVAIENAGFDGIEIFEQDFIGFDLRPTDVRKMVADHGLEITLFQPFRDFEGLPQGPLRQRAFNRAKRKFELMCELGVDLMLVCSSVHPAALGGITRCADDFAELGDMASCFDIKVGYEALAWGRFIYDHRDAWEIVRRADHPNIGLILDSFHTLARKIDPDSIRSIPADKIAFVQLADAPAIDMDLLYWSRHFRNMPGEGDLNLDGFMDAVHATGYEGPISLEIFNDQFRRGNAEIVAKDGYRSLINLMDGIRKRTDCPAPHLPMLPDRAHLTGILYIEFACSETDASLLEAKLRQMGFTLAGHHKSKLVKRFQNNDVNILLNSDPAGRSFERVQKRGPVVSEIALTTNKAEAGYERATSLGAVPVAIPYQNGESAMPAVCGVASSLIRFADRQINVWEADFDAVPETPSTASPLKRFDHIAQTMSYDEMLSWSLFYTTIFAMHKSPMVDVIDPDGIIKSQIISTDDRCVQLTLNGSDAFRTSANNFLAEGVGATVQHIAFQTDDAVALAMTMVSSGFDILPQTENYYADLAARFELSDEFTAQIQSLNILYDEDETGCFLHFYGLSFGNGLFFEFVQRMKNYTGFGAPNAPFRLAAQRRQTALCS